MNRPKITIVDYGMGNLFSLHSALKFIGADPVISDDPKQIQNAKMLILPGVGAFGRGMHELEQRSLKQAILNFVQMDRPLMGICLGMQLLMSKSYEFGEFEGLNIIQGEVVPFMKQRVRGTLLKVPHVGWNSIESHRTSDSLLKGIQSPADFYFVHSYFIVPEENADVLAVSRYGEDQFCSVVKRRQIVGCQFHPEKSGLVGLRLLKNFISSVDQMGKPLFPVPFSAKSHSENAKENLEG